MLGPELGEGVRTILECTWHEVANEHAANALAMSTGRAIGMPVRIIVAA